jgi:hypothetical protein
VRCEALLGPVVAEHVSQSVSRVLLSGLGLESLVLFLFLFFFPFFFADAAVRVELELELELESWRCVGK